MPVSTEITQEFINYSFYLHRRQKKRNHGIKQLIFLPQKMSKMKKFKISRQKSPDNVLFLIKLFPVQAVTNYQEKKECFTIILYRLCILSWQ